MPALLGRVLVIGVALSMVSACSPKSGETPPPAAQTSAQTSVSVTPSGSQAIGDGAAALKDGRHPVRFTKVDAAARTVTFDLLQFLTGAAAKAEWIKVHPEEPDGPPNDYMIINNNPLLRTLPVAADATVKVLNKETADPTTPLQIPFADLTAYISAGIFWMTVSKGAVTLIEEQFLP